MIDPQSVVLVLTMVFLQVYDVKQVVYKFVMPGAKGWGRSSPSISPAPGTTPVSVATSSICSGSQSLV